MTKEELVRKGKKHANQAGFHAVQVRALLGDIRKLHKRIDYHLAKAEQYLKLAEGKEES